MVKHSLGRADFRVDARRLRSEALLQGYRELPIRANHVLATAELPSIHSDPFDRLLLAQARYEQLSFLTANRKVLQYGEGTVEV